MTGNRADRKHPFKVEKDKPLRERGSYLSPEAYNQPEELGVEWVRNPESMKQRKQQRDEFERMLVTQKVKETDQMRSLDGRTCNVKICE